MNINSLCWNIYVRIEKTPQKKKGLFYAGQWQETVVYESAGLIDWVKKIIN